MTITNNKTGNHRVFSTLNERGNRTASLKLSMLFPLTLLFAAFGNNAHADGLTFVHTDHLGTPVAYTNGKGEVIGREQVTPYGESLNPPTGNDQPAFTSHVRDGATGLVYMQARYYDPVTGRMLSADPVEFSGGGVSHFGRYHYANGNPVNLVDPTGMIAHREDAFDCSNDANCKDMAGGGAATRSASTGGSAPESQTPGENGGGSSNGTASDAPGLTPTTPNPVAEINTADGLGISLQTIAANLPPLPQWLVDGSAGLGDALLLGTGEYLREFAGVSGGVDTSSTAYAVGSYGAAILGGGRLVYAGLAKGYSIVASSGAAASAFRETLKSNFRLGIGGRWRQPNLAKYGSDSALRRAAGRTNRYMNAYGAGVLGAGINNPD